MGYPYFRNPHIQYLFRGLSSQPFLSFTRETFVGVFRCGNISVIWGWFHSKEPQDLIIVLIECSEKKIQLKRRSSLPGWIDEIFPDEIIHLIEKNPIPKVYQGRVIQMMGRWSHPWRPLFSCGTGLPEFAVKAYTAEMDRNAEPVTSLQNILSFGRYIITPQNPSLDIYTHTYYIYIYTYIYNYIYNYLYCAYTLETRWLLRMIWLIKSHKIGGEHSTLCFWPQDSKWMPFIPVIPQHWESTSLIDHPFSLMINTPSKSCWTYSWTGVPWTDGRGIYWSWEGILY